MRSGGHPPTALHCTTSTPTRCPVSTTRSVIVPSCTAAVRLHPPRRPIAIDDRFLFYCMHQPPPCLSALYHFNAVGRNLRSAPHPPAVFQSTVRSGILRALHYYYYYYLRFYSSPPVPSGSSVIDYRCLWCSSVVCYYPATCHCPIAIGMNKSNVRYISVQNGILLRPPPPSPAAPPRPPSCSRQFKRVHTCEDSAGLPGFTPQRRCS